MTAFNASMIPTRAELMERIETAWAELDRVLVGLDAHQLSVAPHAGGWTISDHLAHLSVWTESAAALVSGQNRSDAMGVDRELWERGSEDEINAAIAVLWGNRSPADVLTAFRAAQSRLRNLIGGMSDEDLARPYSHFQPDSPTYNPNPVVGWIASNTFDHVGMHLPALLELRRQVT